jgi:hypothetical protein
MVVSRSGGGSVVLVDEAAEAVASLDLADGGGRRWLCRLWWLEPERAVRPVDVVMLDEDAQHAGWRWRRLRISSQSRHSARTVLTNRSAMAFARGAPDGRLDDPHPAGPEHLEGTMNRVAPRAAVR